MPAGRWDVYLGHVANKTAAAEPASLSLLLSASPDGSQPLSSGALVQGSADATLTLDTLVDLVPGQVYYLVLQVPEGQLVDLCGPVVLHLQTPGGVVDQPLPIPAQCLVHRGQPLSLPFSFRQLAPSPL